MIFVPEFGFAVAVSFQAVAASVIDFLVVLGSLKVTDKAVFSTVNDVQTLVSDVAVAG